MYKVKIFENFDLKKLENEVNQHLTAISPEMEMTNRVPNFGRVPTIVDIKFTATALNSKGIDSGKYQAYIITKDNEDFDKK